MIKRKLGVNIDHVATIRNARGENYPEPLKAALFAQRGGANSITIHLREDRRHIKGSDLNEIKKIRGIPINLEISANKEMLRIALKNKPSFVCIVPENRKEITTEGGLNVKKNNKKISMIVNRLNHNKIRTSLFVNPNLKDIKLAKKIGTKCIEIHTGKISNKIKNKQNFVNDLENIRKCAKLANLLNLEVHAGHGMDYNTAKILSKIKEIEEFNIGHFIIGESILSGFKKIIKKFKQISK